MPRGQGYKRIDNQVELRSEDPAGCYLYTWTRQGHVGKEVNTYVGECHVCKRVPRMWEAYTYEEKHIGKENTYVGK